MDYDSGYHLLFSNPKLVEDLICHFVPETWVNQLDFSTLQRINTKFHAEILKRREGDIIHRARLKNGNPISQKKGLRLQTEDVTELSEIREMLTFTLFQSQTGGRFDLSFCARGMGKTIGLFDPGKGESQVSQRRLNAR